MNEIHTNTENRDWSDFDLNVSAPSLRGHIVNDHLDLEGAALFGIPKGDIALAKHLGFDLSLVITRIIDKLSMNDDEIVGDVMDSGFFRVTDPKKYKTTLAHSLQYIEHIGAGKIPWGAVYGAWAGAENVTRPDYSALT